MDSQSAKRQLIDYIRKNSGLEQDRHYLGMSQIGRCPRLQHTWLLQGKGNPSDQAHLRCISGYMYEDKIRELLEGAGVTRHMPIASGFDGVLRRNTRELVAPFDSRFRGHIDGETTDGDLAEIKSMDEAGFEQLKRTHELPYAYFAQVQAYMRYGNYHRALVVVVQRDAFNTWILDVPRNDKVGDTLEERAKAILSAIDAGPGGGANLKCECGRCEKSSQELQEHRGRAERNAQGSTARGRFVRTA